MANDSLFFAAKTIGLSMVNGRKPCNLFDAARHNLREIQSELGAAGHIDARKSQHNRILAGPRDAASVVALTKSKADEAGVDLSQKRRDYVQALELVFSLPEQSTIDLFTYFSKCLQWAEVAYGLPVLSAVIHVDEVAPHCHVLMMPLASDGRYVGGEPLAKPLTKKNIESFFQQVAGPAGLKRQAAKLLGAVKQAAIDAVLCECGRRGCPDTLGPLWAVLEAAIKRDPAPALTALGIGREAVEQAHKSNRENPIGIENTHSKPIGFESTASNSQSLSCVGIAALDALHEPETAPAPALKTRLERARQAQGEAMMRASKRKELPRVLERLRDDGITSVIDEHADDLSSWVGY